MTDSNREVVPPSPEPDAAAGTGSGAASGGSATPPDPSRDASTSGLGTMDEQQGDSAEGGAPYSLDGDENPTSPASPSGT